MPKKMAKLILIDLIFKSFSDKFMNNFFIDLRFY